jgi:hypothetical protein
LKTNRDGAFELQAGTEVISGPGVNDPAFHIHYECRGSASATNDHFVFHTTSGAFDLTSCSCCCYEESR